jgi:hypothetical protein
MNKTNCPHYFFEPAFLRNFVYLDCSQKSIFLQFSRDPLILHVYIIIEVIPILLMMVKEIQMKIPSKQASEVLILSILETFNLLT